MRSVTIVAAALALLFFYSGSSYADFILYSYSTGDAEYKSGSVGANVDDLIRKEREFYEHAGGRLVRVLLTCKGAGWIAVANAHNKVGVGCGYPSKESAIVAAVQGCKKIGGSGCANIVGFAYDRGQGLEDDRHIPWAVVDESTGRVLRVTDTDASFPWNLAD